MPFYLIEATSSLCGFAGIFIKVINEEEAGKKVRGLQRGVRVRNEAAQGPMRQGGRKGEGVA